MRKIAHSRRIGLAERLYSAPSLVIGNPCLTECMIECGLEHREHAIGCRPPPPHQLRVVRIECASLWLQRAAFRSQPGGRFCEAGMPLANPSSCQSLEPGVAKRGDNVGIGRDLGCREGLSATSLIIRKVV